MKLTTKTEKILEFIVLAVVLASCQTSGQFTRIDGSTTLANTGVIWQQAFENRLVDWLESDGVLYVLDTSRELTALDVTEGHVLWQKSVSVDGSLNLIEDVVVVDNWNTGTIVGIDQNSGSTLWSTSLPKFSGYSRGIQIVPGKDKVFVGYQDRIYALACFPHFSNRIESEIHSPDEHLWDI